jgi:hypothetical protein
MRSGIPAFEVRICRLEIPPKIIVLILMGLRARLVVVEWAKYIEATVALCGNLTLTFGFEGKKYFFP